MISIPRGRFPAPAPPTPLASFSTRTMGLRCLLAASILVLCRSAAFAAASTPAPAGTKPPAGSLVLITVEGLRPDYLSCYGKAPGKPTSRIDQLAAEG
ncbi:MAG: hypothetical protein L0Z52_05375, partial [Acidobacteria bacterium]|nr:hypothetical protein [Acidobacteriota bacterium]